MISRHILSVLFQNCTDHCGAECLSPPEPDKYLHILLDLTPAALGGRDRVILPITNTISLCYQPVIWRPTCRLPSLTSRHLNLISIQRSPFVRILLYCCENSSHNYELWLSRPLARNVVWVAVLVHWATPTDNLLSGTNEATHRPVEPGRGKNSNGKNKSYSE